MSEPRNTRPPQAEVVPNPWAAAASRNPYLHNVFALLGLDPDASEEDLTDRIERLRVQVQQGVEVVGQGKRIEETDVMRASYLAANEQEYVAERLMAHSVHKPDIKVFDKEMKEIDSIRFPKPADLLPLTIRDVSFVTRLLPQLAQVAAGEIKAMELAQLEEIARPTASEEQRLALS